MNEVFLFDPRRGIVCRRRSGRRPHPIEDRTGVVTGRFQTLAGEVVTLIKWTDRKKVIAYYKPSLRRLQAGDHVRLTVDGLIVKDQQAA